MRVSSSSVRIFLTGLSCLVVHVAGFTGLRAAPTPPAGLTATGEPGQIRLDWQDNTEPDLAGYHIYRSTTSGGPYASLESMRSEILDPVPSPTTTGEKPQSKAWHHGNRWWAVFPDGNGTWLWRLDQSTWTKVLMLSSQTTVQADCKVAGDVTHVLLFNGINSQLVSVQFLAGSPESYELWTDRSSTVDITLSSGVETATIDIDSAGRMWLASDAVSEVEVRYSDYPYATWEGPVVLASGISSDDICAVTALGDGTVGVLWSDQQSQRFGFRTHLDGEPPTSWSADEVPASQSAQNVGSGMADDHLNLAVAADNTLYAAVKTSYDTAGYPKIALLVRRPNGLWDDLYEVDTAGTRPIVVLNEATAQLKVIYTAAEGLNDIVYRESALDMIQFGQRQTLLAGAWNDASSVKQGVPGSLLVLVASGTQIGGLHEQTGPILAPDSEFVDEDVSPGQTYYYVVTALDTTGGESGFSGEAAAAPLAPPLTLQAIALQVAVGNVSGNLEDTFTADGTSQLISESGTGPKALAACVAEYTLGTVPDPSQVTSLILQFQGSWSAHDAGDPLVAAVWNHALSRWDDLNWVVSSNPMLYEADLSAAANDYLDGSGVVRVLFRDGAELEHERKDTVAVDRLVATVLSGPDTAPSAPQNLTALPGDTRIDLFWEPNPEPDVVGYDIERDGVIIASVGEVTDYADLGLANEILHTYRIMAIDGGGQWSLPSEPVTAAASASFAPRAPTGLTAAAADGKVSLTWEGNQETRTVSYQVYRSTTSPVPLGPDTLLAEVSHVGEGTLHAYDDLDVAVSETTTFYYVLTATDLDGDVSVPSSQVMATVSVVSPEELFIITAEYSIKPKKLEVTASSSLGDAVVLTLYGGADETSIDFDVPLLEALVYDNANNVHVGRLRIDPPPGWVAVTSTGGGTPASAPVTFK